MNRRTRSTRRPGLRLESLEGRALLSVSSSDSVFVRFQAGATPAQIATDLASVRGSVASSFADGPDLVALGQGEDPAEAIRRLSADRSVAYATPNATIRASSLPVTPNDPDYPLQWGLNNPINNVDIDAPEAWGITTGSPSTIVAVIDTGIDLSNPDFAGRIWTNPVNDAAAGYPNDIHGWNFVSDNNNVGDDNGHGTHVSAILGAAGNNASGVAGIDWQTQIMPLKFLGSDGTGLTSDAVSAIYYAVNHGARVINASWGGVDYSAPLRDAIAYAAANNVVFVTAAGNDGTDNDTSPSYPGTFRLPNEISVAAVDRNGNLPSFSNYGAQTVDVAAPGVGIVSDYPTYIDPTGLQSLTGTSMSTAFVSGVVALLEGVDPALTAPEVVHVIDTTAKALPSLVGKTISGGMVDADNALVAVTGGTLAAAAGGVTPAGLPSLSPGTATVEQVQATILASDEFYADQGGTPQGYITGLYNDLLGRYPDPAGLQQWVDTLGAPGSTRYSVASAILTSPEGRLTEVAHWFQDDLGRNESLADLKADPGVAAWANLIDLGFGDNTVEAAIIASPEFVQDHGSTPSGIVDGLYQTLLDRDAGAEGEAAWDGLVATSSSPFPAVRLFQGTPEAQQTQVARWFVRDLGRPSSVADLKLDPGLDALAAELGNY